MTNSEVLSQWVSHTMPVLSLYTSQRDSESTDQMPAIVCQWNGQCLHSLHITRIDGIITLWFPNSLFVSTKILESSLSCEESSECVAKAFNNNRVIGFEYLFIRLLVANVVCFHICGPEVFITDISESATLHLNSNGRGLAAIIING